tara:strand:+ start:5865 stop:6893 length:1029 start_codon:yes stop_codon:yes gene_type:complete
MAMHRFEGAHIGEGEFTPEVLDWIARENWWNLWVPESFGGLGMSLPEGLETLRSLARLDGSLGWTVTLCSGANYFIGNLEGDVAKGIFMGSKAPVCFGGSGGVFGTADREGDTYVVSGTWKYATGAPYLTHFTLNARVRENGTDVIREDGTPLVRSFVLGRKDVEIIRDWNTMGLRATATHSFAVRAKRVHGRYSFSYDELYRSDPIFKIPFGVFADLTLWVNYIGMAEHFWEEARKVAGRNDFVDRLQRAVSDADGECSGHGERIWHLVSKAEGIPEAYAREIHQNATDSVGLLAEAVVKGYPMLGIRAATMGHPLNRVFRDFFTATQHHIFSPLGRRGHR